MAKQTIGIIGLGSIGQRHATNLWKNLGQTEVIGYDPDLKEKHGWICGDLDFLIKTATAIVIASPTVMHYDHIVACDHKLKFVEKPIADKYFADKSRGTSLYYHKENILMVGYNLRFHTCVIHARTWLDTGMIGKPLWANFTLGQKSEKPPYLRDGVILNWSHEIDLALYLLGPGSVACSSTRLSDGRDDLTDILFTHKNGCRSSIHLDYVTDPQVRQSVIVGKNGTIIFDLVNHQAWLRSKKGDIIDHHAANPDWNDTYVDEMKAFLDRIDGKETRGATAQEGLEALNVCLEVRKQAGL